MSEERRKPFPFDTFEPKWQQFWKDNKTYHVANPGDDNFDASKPKYYALDMFPYPSGAGLHVGHPEGYTATDIISRKRRMDGYNVLHAMGWDAFGLPAEQHAIKTGEHPSINTEKNVNNFRSQLQNLGFCYDWDREINTTAPNYFKWTQWIFLQIYNSYFNEEKQKACPVSELEDQGWTPEQIDEVRLAYVDEVPVNWSPSLGTVLANEELEEWIAKGETVERRPIRQWMMRITKYAQRLIDELEDLDWPESIKRHQRNWIGRSDGAHVTFPIENHTDHSIEVYTTRPDTLFGATYMVLAPEHSLVDQITSKDQKQAIEEYRKTAATKSDLDRTELAKKKTGVPTGAYAINPVNGDQIPIWIADYVLVSYGTGAIMAVPGHDERDYEFAKQFSIEIKQVVTNEDKTADLTESAFSEYGIAINSSSNKISIDGLTTAEAKDKMATWLEEQEIGKTAINYKLRDWNFSRQRYWGEPFPIIWENGQHQAIPETELPVQAPVMEDYKPTGSPEGPLAKATDWITYSETATRETNTMPQWAGSCWYYLRYCDAKNDSRFIGEKAEKYWMGDGSQNIGGVDLYIGGTEHAVLHLLYSRFWHKILNDLGHVSTIEPFHKLVNQGLILGADGNKMSKSIGNVVNPDDVVDEYGADSLRLYEMFMGPLEQTKPWKMEGVEGVSRFLARVWRIVFEQNQEGNWEKKINLTDEAHDTNKDLLKVVHETIKKVGEDIETLSFNTAISQLMICTNAFTKAETVPVVLLTEFLKLLSPFAPHIAEELWQQIDQKGLASEQSWPQYNEEYLVESEIEMAVQINGKMRDKILIDTNATDEEIEERAKQSEKVANHLEGTTIRKVIVVPGRLVNIVAN